MSADSDPVQLVLEVWHPDCWTIDTTERTAAGVLGRVVASTTGDTFTALATLYADRRQALDDATETIRDAPQVHMVSEVPHTTPEAVTLDAKPGNATRDLLIEHEASSQISGAFLSRGFVTVQPVDTHDGRERWNLLTTLSRDEIHGALDTIAETHDADITIERISRTTDAAAEAPFSLTTLSARQREVFELARARGYYEWPKEISGSELAAELDIATATLHEHLHKAESKLLGTSRWDDR
jgi:predicted DNA binding protein